MQEYRENKLHGQPEFPFVVYPGNLPGYLTSYPLHWHDELELIYVVSGKGNVTVHSERLTVQTGDMVLIQPQRVHGIEQLRDSNMVYFNILFRLSLLGSAYAQQLYGHSRSIPAYLPKGSRLNEKLKDPVLELILNRKKADSDYALMIQSHLCVICYHILHDRPERDEADNNRQINYDKLKVVLEYLCDNFSQDTSVEEAASMCGFSPSHFMKLFRELTGTSYAQYVKNLRLDTAAELLRTTGKRVSDIAEEVGFHNLPYFTRAFGRKYQMSPLSYRKKGSGSMIQQ